MVEIELDDSLSVGITAGTEKPCAYGVVYEGEEVVRYETSADPRTPGGRVGLRNVVYRRVPNGDYNKKVIGERLSAAIGDHEEALAEELGPR